MPEPYRHIVVARRDGAFCVRLRPRHLPEESIYELFEELLGLVHLEGCRRMALSLGPENHEFLYSVFLAKLITVQRVLHEQGGELILCEATPEVHTIFEACKLDGQFRFMATFDDALAAWK
jgi:hypothetical protein